VCFAANKEQQTAEPSSSGQNDVAAAQYGSKVYREFKSLGSKVIETNQPLPGPEDEKDFWEGEQFDAFGKAVETYFLPGLLVLGLICGGIAASSYNDGASSYVKGATSPEDTGSIIIAADVLAQESVIAPSTSD